MLWRNQRGPDSMRSYIIGPQFENVKNMHAIDYNTQNIADD